MAVFGRKLPVRGSVRKAEKAADPRIACYNNRTVERSAPIVVSRSIRAGCRLGRACLSRAVNRPAGQREERNKKCGHCCDQQLQVEGHCGEERLDPHFGSPRRIARPVQARCLGHLRWEVGTGVLVRAYLTQSTLHDHIACESGDPWDYYLDRGCGRAGEPSVAAPRSRIVSERISICRSSGVAEGYPLRSVQ